MKYPRVKIVTGGILFITIVFVCWIHHPLPPYQGEWPLSGLKSPVDVFTDEFGVPHVFAENEDDLFFTAGYLSGRERLFQLSTVALAVRGELSSALQLK
jgi:penicillin amidase